MTLISEQLDLGWRFDPNEPRDAHGRWTRGGSGYVVPDTERLTIPPPRKPNPKMPYYAHPRDHPFFAAHPVSAKNIVDAFDKANDEEIAQGRRWYADAHVLATAIGRGDTTKGAGLLASYSPQSPWPVNMFNAARAMELGRAIGPGEGMITGSMQANAQEAMDGLSTDENFKHGAPKIHAFAKLIENGGDEPDDTEGQVVLDRHAMSVAMGVRLPKKEADKAPIGTKRYYDHVADAYREATRRINARGGEQYTPHQIQAITWLRQQRANAVEDRAGAVGHGGKGAGKGRQVMIERAWENWRQLEQTEHYPVVRGTTEMTNLITSQLNLAGGWHDAWRHERRAPDGRWIKGAVTGDRGESEPYWIKHRPPDTGTGAPAHDLEQVFPDIYDHPEYYDSGAFPGDRLWFADKQTFAAIRAARGKPNAMVTVYRGGPKVMTRVNPGDWVTTSKIDAENEADKEPGGHVISIKVPARELWNQGDSIHEFGWHPQRAAHTADAIADANVSDAIIREWKLAEDPQVRDHLNKAGANWDGGNRDGAVEEIRTASLWYDQAGNQGAGDRLRALADRIASTPGKVDTGEPDSLLKADLKDIARKVQMYRGGRDLPGEVDYQAGVAIEMLENGDLTGGRAALAAASRQARTKGYLHSDADIAQFREFARQTQAAEYRANERAKKAASNIGDLPRIRNEVMLEQDQADADGHMEMYSYLGNAVRVMQRAESGTNWPSVAANWIMKAAERARDYGDREKYHKLLGLAHDTIMISPEPVAPDSPQGIATSLTAKASEFVPDLLGGGHLDWDHKPVTLYPAEDNPYILASSDWNGHIDMQREYADDLASAVNNPDKVVQNPDAFGVIDHELIHLDIPEAQRNRSDKDQSAYQQREYADIEEGFTELAQIQHAPEFFDKMGIGNRPTNMVAEGAPDNPKFAMAAARFAAELQQQWVQLVSDPRAPQQMAAQHLGGAIEDIKADPMAIQADNVMEALYEVQHLGDHNLSQWAMKMTSRAAAIREIPMTRHATMREYAQRLQDPERIKAGDAWHHYPDQTAWAEQWVEMVARQEGHRGKNPRPGSSMWKRMVELSDQINREGTANKPTVMASQLYGLLMKDAPNKDDPAVHDAIMRVIRGSILRAWATGMDPVSMVMKEAKTKVAEAA